MAKTFKDKIQAPAMDFITAAEDTTAQAKENATEQGYSVTVRELPGGILRAHINKRERKTDHIHMLMRPSLHNKGVEAAQALGMSFSELIEELLEQYLDSEGE